MKERLRKLENERTSLHMEISFLSEQVEVQSNKITELEEALQDKKDALRQLEESLQKVIFQFIISQKIKIFLNIPLSSQNTK